MLISLIPFFLCWGSFLNVLGFRLIQGIDVIVTPSFCPHCSSRIAWYDNIPVVSWLILNGSCRSCHQPISWLYPFIELLTALCLSLVVLYTPSQYWFAYGLFVSALIVTVRSDLETMLISRVVTLYALPLGWLCSWLGWLPISIVESLFGSLVGYAMLWIVSRSYFLIKGQEGMGEGDLELLAFIGSFTGPLGCWAAVLIGSITGTLAGIIQIMRQGKSERIPFGPFLALGAFIFILTCSHFFDLLGILWNPS